ncbi:MAG: CcmD family protein [Dehalococcoidia bacterium]
MHQNLGYLFAAFAATWLALFAYIFFMQRRLQETRWRLHQLEDDSGAAKQGEGLVRDE